MLQKMLSSPLWHLMVQADSITRVVLFILLFMSVTCWSVFVYKLVLLRIKKRHMKRAFDQIKHVGSLEDLVLVTDNCAGTTPGYFLHANMQCLKSMIEVGKPGAGKLGVAHWQRLQDTLYFNVDDIMHHEEGLLWILSTSAGVATLLGLFGTVWGLVHSFVSISEKQNADIATVAPGIAEALVTTVAGLMVAIPAFVMFNYLNTQIRRMEQKLYAMVQMFNRVIQVMFAN